MMSQDKRTVQGKWQLALETLRLTMRQRDLRGLRAAKQDRGQRQAPPAPHAGGPASSGGPGDKGLRCLSSWKSHTGQSGC